MCFQRWAPNFPTEDPIVPTHIKPPKIPTLFRGLSYNFNSQKGLLQYKRRFLDLIFFTFKGSKMPFSGNVYHLFYLRYCNFYKLSLNAKKITSGGYENDDDDKEDRTLSIMQIIFCIRNFVSD